MAMVSANCRAASSDGGCPLNAIGGGCVARSAQCVHFEIFGARELHSAVGTSQGHASWQYRQPMRLAMSINVALRGPSVAAVVMCAPSVLRIVAWPSGRS